MALRTTLGDRFQALAKRRRDRAYSALERKRTGMAFEPEAHPANPFPHYAALRERDPIHRHPRRDGLVLTRYEDCLAVLCDPRFSSETRNVRHHDRLKAQRRGDGADAMSGGGTSFLNLDPPEHTRLRGLVSRVFTPRAVSRLAPRIEAIAGELIEGLRPGADFDWMETVAHPMPAIVISPAKA